MHRTALIEQLTTLLSAAHDHEAVYAISVIGEHDIEYKFSLSAPEKRLELVKQLKQAIDDVSNKKIEIVYFTLWNIKFEFNLVKHGRPVPPYVLASMRSDANWLILNDKVERLKNITGDNRLEEMNRTSFISESKAMPDDLTIYQAELLAAQFMDKYNLPYFDAKAMVMIITEMKFGNSFKRAYSRRISELTNLRKTTEYTNLTGNYTLNYVKDDTNVRASKNVVAISEHDACATLKQLTSSITDVTVAMAS